MSSPIDIQPYLIDGSKPFRVADHPTSLDEDLYTEKSHYKSQLKDLRDDLSDLQELQYAHDRHGLLVVFQAMDAAGKDSTIRGAFSGVNPHGLAVHSFKRPSNEELDHGYLWRTDDHVPRRGHISIFNRSYYEEVLVVRVHPEIVTKFQRIPAERVGDPDNLDPLWEKRFRHIRDREQECFDNGTKVIKFFLNVSRDEQARRFLSRIQEPSKNWKFESGDIKERGYWEDYMRAYEDAINATATPDSPWYCVPADDKKNMRLIVASVMKAEMEALPMEWPKLTAEETTQLEEYGVQLNKELLG